MITWLKIGASVVAGLLIGFAAGEWSGGRIERAKMEAAAAKDALERIEQLEKNNADFKRGTDRERCLIFMRDSKLPADNCN